MKTYPKSILFFIQLFCRHKWSYNYKKNYYRCKKCYVKRTIIN